MKVERWVAWYTEERVFYSKNISWEDLPGDGVLFIMLYLDTYNLNSKQYPMTVYIGKGIQLRREMSGFDWYFKQGDLYGSNNDSLEENQIRYPTAIFKRGKWTTDEKFKQIEAKALIREKVSCTTCN